MPLFSEETLNLMQEMADNELMRKFPGSDGFLLRIIQLLEEILAELKSV